MEEANKQLKEKLNVTLDLRCVESGGYYISEYMIGSQFLAYLVPSYEDGVW